jgi:hypothetical protein
MSAQKDSASESVQVRMHPVVLRDGVELEISPC